MKQSRNLFDLTEEQLKILERIEEVAEESEGEIPDELWDVLKVNEKELNDKVSAYVFRLAEFKLQQETLKAQIEIWEKKIEKKERAIGFLKAGLAEVTKRLGKQNEKGNYSLQAGEIKVNYQHTYPIEITDETKVPEEYKKYNLVLKNMKKHQLDIILENIMVPVIKDGEQDLQCIVDAKVETEINISKTSIKNAIETASDKVKTNEFTTSETVPGAFIDNKKGFIKTY